MRIFLNQIFREGEDNIKIWVTGEEVEITLKVCLNWTSRGDYDFKIQSMSKIIRGT